MSKLKRGDRVICFGQAIDTMYIAASIEGDAGEVVGFRKDGLIRVLLDADPCADRLVYHPKQCRKLVKKERRRVWINERHFEGSQLRIDDGTFWKKDKSAEFQYDLIEFIEVRKKKKE